MEQLKNYIFIGVIIYLSIGVAHGGQQCSSASTTYDCTGANVQDNKCTVPGVAKILVANVKLIEDPYTCEAADYPLETSATGQFAWHGAYLYLTSDCRAEFRIIHEICVDNPELECEAKSKTHGCSNNAQVDNNQCEVPQVEDNDILYVTVHRDEPVVDHVCNLATYPLDDPNGHVGLFTWNGATIYLDNECRAVFVVHWYECVPVAHSCYIHGDPHFNSTDGHTYTFTGQTPCDYVLVDDQATLSIIGTFVKCRTSCLNKLIIEYGGRTYILGPKGAVKEGLTDLTLTYMYPATEPYQVIIEEHAGNQIKILLDNGVYVYWNKKNAARIVIPYSFMDILVGMCGNFNGNAADDLEGLSAEAFGMSHLVPASCPEEGP